MFYKSVRLFNFFIELLSRECCSQHCLENWSFKELLNFLSITVELNEKQKIEKVQDLLKNNRIESEVMGYSIVCGEYFLLKASGKTCCPKAFAWLHNVGESKLRTIVEITFQDDNPQPMDIENLDRVLMETPLYKKDLVLSWLTHIYKSEIWSDLKLGDIEDVIRIKEETEEHKNIAQNLTKLSYIWQTRSPVFPNFNSML